MEIIAPLINGLISQDGTGAYQLLLKEAALRSNIKIVEKIYPQKRAISNFFNKKQSCIYAYTDIAEQKMGKQNIKASFPLSVFKQYIFTKKGTKPFTEISQLKGLTVAGTLGDEDQDWFSSFKEAQINYLLLSHLDLNIKMLRSNRVDAVVSFLPDFSKFISELVYAVDQPLFTAFDRITCHNSLESAIFIQKISASLKVMKLDGTTKRILGNMYLEFDNFDASLK